MFSKIDFSLSESQKKKIDEWENSHNCNLPQMHGIPHYCGPIGGRFSITFTPTSIGMFATVKCACGETLDISEL